MQIKQLQNEIIVSTLYFFPLLVCWLAALASPAFRLQVNRCEPRIGRPEKMRNVKNIFSSKQTNQSDCSKCEEHNACHRRFLLPFLFGFSHLPLDSAFFHQLLGFILASLPNRPCQFLRMLIVDLASFLVSYLFPQNFIW